MAKMMMMTMVAVHFPALFLANIWIGSSNNNIGRLGLAT